MSDKQSEGTKGKYRKQSKLERMPAQGCGVVPCSCCEQSGSLPVETTAPVARMAQAVTSAWLASHPSSASGSKIHAVSSATREAKRRSPSSETSAHSLLRTHPGSHTRHKCTTARRSTSITSRRVPGSGNSDTTTPGGRALQASGCRQRRRRQLGYPDRSHRRRRPADDKAKQKIRRRRRCRLRRRRHALGKGR